MSGIKNPKSYRRLDLARNKTTGTFAIAPALLSFGLAFGLASPAAAQSVPPPSTVVSVCSGVSLPRSVVTGIVSPVLTGIYGPIEANVNGTLAALGNPLLGLVGLPAPLSVNVNGLLTQAASGGNIGLNVVARDGTLVGPGSTCNATANSFMLDNPAGLAIGGNQITGLGAAGQQASAGEINSIAFGNRAATNGTALASIALGPDASVGAGGTGSVALGSGSSATAANSVALGAGSVAARGPLAGYVAPLLGGTFTSVGEISVGAPGALRQITNIAPGSAPTDAVNLQQLLAVSALVPTDPVVYDNPAHGSITLTGAGGTAIRNVAPGALAATSTDAVNGAQLFATNSQVTTNTSNIASIQVQLGNLTVAGGSPVQYSNPGSPTTANGGIPTNDTTLVGAVAGPVGLHNVAGGTVAAGSTDAVNGGQLATTNLAVVSAQNTANGAQTAANGAQATANGAQATATTALGLATNSVQYDNAQHSSVTFSNATGPTLLSNVAAGGLTATSTDAVNGSQLFALSQQVAASATPNAVTYTDASQKTVALGGAGGTTVTNVASAALSATSTDAVNGAQLFATNGQVQTNTTGISNLNTQVTTNTSAISNLNTQVTTNTSNISTIQVQLGNLTVAGGSPLQYSNPASPTTSNGGIPTNDTTLVGAVAGPVGVHNVASGTIAAGSTDAVNGGQLAVTNQAVATAQGTANTALTAANTAQTTAVAAQGTANTALTTANGAQTTAVAAQGTANTALGLAANSVQYDNPQRTSVTFDAGGAPTRLGNVAAGTAANDAVNFGQLQSVVNGAMSTAISTAVTQANNYTDSRITALSYDLRSARREARSGSAAALAAAALPQPTEGGKTMIAGGVGVYAGRTAFAIGAAHATDDGRSVFRLGVTYDASQHVGANAGAGFQF